MLKRNKNKILTAIFFLLSLNSTSANEFFVEAEDTIAGKSSQITSSTLKEGERLEIKITKPNEEKIVLNGFVGVNGKLEKEVLSYHTKQSGTYKIEVNGQNGSSKTDFFVYPSKMSESKSNFYSSEKSVSAKVDKVKILIEISDFYGNKIPNQKIKLLSSRTSDNFDSECSTNQNGKCSFEVISDEEGTSIFTAINLTENKTLKERVKVIFYTAEEKNAIGGSPYLASLINDSKKSLISNYGNSEDFGVIKKFEIETNEEFILNSIDNYMKIIAKDEDGNTVKDYIGTIKIVIPNDENAILPLDGQYTFTAEDQGEKRFDLATTFKSVGNQKIEVYDYSDGFINEEIYGKKEISVINEEKKISNSSEENSEFKIISPIDGTKFGSNQIDITGKALPFTDLKIYVNEKKEGDVISVDKEGIFSARIGGLKDGENEIHVTEIEGQKRSSNSVYIEIDTKGPVINDIVINPKEVEVESNFVIKIYSEKNLSQAKVNVDGNIENLTEISGEEGSYEATVLSPSVSGDYPLDFVVTDEMGNKENYKNQVNLKVVDREIKAPEKITNLNLESEKNKIKIKWQEVFGKTEIKEYKVYIGENKNDLKFFGNTKVNDINIEQLKYDTEYFIAVSAVNIEGLEGEKSEIKSVTTKSKEAETHGSAISDFFTGEKLLKAFSSDSRVTLKWKSLGTKVVKYKIEYGIEKDFFEEEIVTPDNVNTWYIEDLINGLDYYFRVTGLDSEGNVITDNTNIVSAKPQGKGLLKSGGSLNQKIDNIDEVVEKKGGESSKTGPEIWFILAFALLIGDFFARRMFRK